MAKLVHQLIMKQLIFGLLLLSGCISIPKESIQLTEALATMLKSSKAAHISLINRHFDVLSLNVEKFAVTEYKETFLNNIRNIMKSRDPEFTELTFEQYDKAMVRIFETKNSWFNMINHAKLKLLMQIEQYYNDMAEINNAIHILLKSTTDSNESTNGVLNTIDKDLSNKTKKIETDVFDTIIGLEKTIFGTKVGN